jgi:hypothetical protein
MVERRRVTVSGGLAVGAEAGTRGLFQFMARRLSLSLPGSPPGAAGVAVP